MKLGLKTIVGTLLGLSISGISSALAAPPIENANGFDWIGTNPLSISGGFCSNSNIENPNRYYAAATSFKLPGTGSTRYSPQRFEGIMGIVPPGDAPPNWTPTPNSNITIKVALYDSFEAFRANAVTGAIKTWDFLPNHTSQEMSLVGPCSSLQGTINCYKVSVDLSLADTITPVGSLNLIGGQRYWLAMFGIPQNFQTNGYPCALRTNLNMADNLSPQINPSITYPLSATQCTALGQPPGCHYTLSTSEFYKIQHPGCNPNLPPGPPSSAGTPCERNFMSRLGYALRVQKLCNTSKTHTSYGSPYSDIRSMPVNQCNFASIEVE